MPFVLARSLRRAASVKDVTASKPLVGSSRNKTFGAATSSMPMFTRFRCPPDTPLLFSSPMTELTTWSISRKFSASNTAFRRSSDVFDAGSL
mmetsp:Transcript_28294/g.39346  ORF Transcript_28294/g.39346 Transcript_28294/m.39346 type:complete len:92 (+) Transcript_28294:1755-2030(+)